MQLRKFYGRTPTSALARIKRELGPDALILETRRIEPDSAAGRMYPGMRYEICAVREVEYQTSRTQTPASSPPWQATNKTQPDQPNEPRQPEQPEKSTPPASLQLYGQSVLEDMGMLKTQLEQLLASEGQMHDPAGCESVLSNRRHLEDYQSLLALGVDHRLLAPHFRRWLQWKTAGAQLRRFLAGEYHEAALIQSEDFREWLWLAWVQSQGLLNEDASSGNQNAQGLYLQALVGPSGAGKTTTLAKMATLLCQQTGKKGLILTLDTFRLGATDQWRRFSKLSAMPVHEIANEADLAQSRESWGQFDWIGVDTPGGLEGKASARRLFDQVRESGVTVRTNVVVPAAYRESAVREQYERQQGHAPTGMIYTKLDETHERGGMLNVTMQQNWKIEGLASGQKIPQDYCRADRQALWDWVLRPSAEEEQAGAWL